MARSSIEDSIIDDDAQVIGAKITSSLIGARAQVYGLEGIINIGEDAVVKNA